MSTHYTNTIYRRAQNGKKKMLSIAERMISRKTYALFVECFGCRSANWCILPIQFYCCFYFSSFLPHPKIHSRNSNVGNAISQSLNFPFACFFSYLKLKALGNGRSRAHSWNSSSHWWSRLPGSGMRDIVECAFSLLFIRVDAGMPTAVSCIGMRIWGYEATIAHCRHGTRPKSGWHNSFVNLAQRSTNA